MNSPYYFKYKYYKQKYNAKRLGHPDQQAGAGKDKDPDPDPDQDILLRLAICQPLSSNSVAESLDQLEGYAQEASQQKSDLLIFPELYLGGYQLENVSARAILRHGPELTRVSKIAKRTGLVIVVGYAELSDHPEPLYFNSAIVFDPSGQELAHYRKTYLFGEAEKRVFTPGHDVGQCFNVAGIPTSLLICYDLEFPENARKCALNGAKLLLVPTANMRPFDTVNKIVTRCRALENHITVCYCNWGEFTSPEGVQFNGLSILAGPSGNKKVVFKKGEDGLKIGQITAEEVLPESRYEGADNYLEDFQKIFSKTVEPVGLGMGVGLG